jgi:hypothetical protein
VIHFSSARLSDDQISADAESSAKRTSSRHDSSASASTRIVTWERWLCAP